MKKILLILLVAFLTINASGQVKKPENTTLSNIESFSNRSGTLIKKEFTDFGKVKSVKIQLLKITDLTTNKAEAGLRFEYEGTGTYATTHVAFLDGDEIDGLLKTIDYVNKTVFSSDPTGNETEYNFVSRGGFTAGAFNYNKKWFFYMKLDKYSSDSQVDFSQDDLAKIKEEVTLVQGGL